MKCFASVSGGLDSTAMAIILSQKHPEYEYIFADTGDEFPQVFKHLDKMESVLGIKIIRVKNHRYTLGEYEIKSKYFPSYQSRFCTRMFKIKPIQEYCSRYKPYKMAIGLRADEDRTGGLGRECIYPLKEYGIKKCDVVTLCQAKGLIPQYPWYMSRGGCYSCFFKSKNELLALAKYEPELFNNLIEREEYINSKFNVRYKYYTMFDKFNIPLRRVKEIADSQEQIEMFERGNTYDADCGVFCRK